MNDDAEKAACTPFQVDRAHFNTNAALPYGCTIDHIFAAMTDFVAFLGLINQQLFARELPRLESIVMPANFSSIVGEFMVSGIDHACLSLVKNGYHNGHPDLIPADMFAGNAVQHTHHGIEVKASRYRSGWQGHNPESVWLLVFVFASNRPADRSQAGYRPMPFRFLEVLGGQLDFEDWSYSGRSATSRRTITAHVSADGRRKLLANWIYRHPELE